jgi:hypothetical protein
MILNPNKADNINEVETKFLDKNKILLSEEQQKEVLKRSQLYKEGKIKGYSLADVRKRLK